MSGRRGVAVGVSMLLAVAACGGSSHKAGTTAKSSLQATPEHARTVLAQELASVAPPALVAAFPAIKAKLGTAATAPPRVRLTRAEVTTGDLDAAAFGVDILLSGQFVPSQFGSEALANEMNGAVSGGLDQTPDTAHGTEHNETPYSVQQGNTIVNGSIGITVDVNIEHSLVKVDVTRTLTSNAFDKNPPFTSSLRNVISANFCPDASGSVPVSISSNLSVTSTQSLHRSVSGEFTGHVNDNAFLAGIDGNATFSGSNEAKQSSYDGTIGDISVDVSGGTVGDMTAGAANGHETNADLQDWAKIARTDLDLALKKIMGTAQDLWRDNACVTPVIRDWNAYGKPKGDQSPGNPNFTKEVAPSSKTEFNVAVHQRYEHKDLSLPVTEKLVDGEKKLEPGSISPTPGKGTYTAGDKPQQIANAMFDSVSRRGRAVMFGRFFTEEPPPIMSLTGTLSDNYSISSATGTVTVPRTQFSGTIVDNQVTYEADVPVTVQIRGTLSGIALPCALTSTERGTLHLTARGESQGDTRVWVFTPDPARSHFTAAGQCIISVGNSFSGGGSYGAKFFAALGPFTVPQKPNTTKVSHSRPVAGGTDAATANVTIYEPPKK